jgi:hypothetical protein
VSAASSSATREDVAQMIEKATSEIIAALPKEDSRVWKLTSLVLPIVLTSLLGFFVYLIQSGIEGRIDDNSKRLQATLSLTQDFYQSRLKIYLAIHEGAVRIEEKAAIAGGVAGGDSGLEDNVISFHDAYSINSILLSRDLRLLLKDFWNDATSAVRRDEITSDDVSKILSGFDRLEWQMRRDLLVDELFPPQPPSARTSWPTRPASAGPATSP